MGAAGNAMAGDDDELRVADVNVDGNAKKVVKAARAGHDALSMHS